MVSAATGPRVAGSLTASTPGSAAPGSATPGSATPGTSAGGAPSVAHAHGELLETGDHLDDLLGQTNYTTNYALKYAMIYIYIAEDFLDISNILYIFSISVHNYSLRGGGGGGGRGGTDIKQLWNILSN